MQTNQIAEAARSKLAQDLGLPPEDIAIESIEAAEWPDPSLGIPTPGQMYVQVITPGYLIKLKHGTERYEYRSNESGSILRYNPTS